MVSEACTLSTNFCILASSLSTATAAELSDFVTASVLVDGTLGRGGGGCPRCYLTAAAVRLGASSPGGASPPSNGGLHSSSDSFEALHMSYPSTCHTSGVCP